MVSHRAIISLDSVTLDIHNRSLIITVPRTNGGHALPTAKNASTNCPSPKNRKKTRRYLSQLFQGNKKRVSPIQALGRKGDCVRRDGELVNDRDSVINKVTFANAVF